MMTLRRIESTGNLIFRLAASLQAIADQEYRQLGLNLFSARTLFAIHLNEHPTVNEIVEVTQLDQSTLSHILKRLMRDGLITKERQLSDNRVVRVKLTEEGVSRAAAIHAISQSFDTLLDQGLSADERKRARAMMERLYHNVLTHEQHIVDHHSKQ